MDFNTALSIITIDAVKKNNYWLINSIGNSYNIKNILDDDNNNLLPYANTKEMIDELINFGILVNGLNKYGHTAIYYMTDIELIKYLIIRYGANVIVNKEYTPHDHYISVNNVELAYQYSEFITTPNENFKLERISPLTMHSLSFR